MTKFFLPKTELWHLNSSGFPANGQGSAKEELNHSLRGRLPATTATSGDSLPARRLASVGKEFVSNGDDSFRAFCYQSQGDCVPKPKVGLRHEGLPWGNVPRMIYNPNGVASGIADLCLVSTMHTRHAPTRILGLSEMTHATPDATPVGLAEYGVISPKVAACRRNLGLWDAIPVGLEAKLMARATPGSH